MAMDARVVADTGDEVLFDAVAEDVLHALEGRRIIEYGTSMVSTPPKSLSPTVESSELSREVALEVLHEGGQVRRTLSRQEQVVVVAHEAMAVELDFEALERVGQDAGDDGVGGRGGMQEQPALEAAVSDEVGGGSLMLKAEKAGHGTNPNEVVPKNLYRAVSADVAQKVV